MPDGVLQDALSLYMQYGWNVIPLVPKGKKAAIKWKELEERRLGAGELAEVFSRSSDYNLGLINGRVSGGVFDVDIDDREILGYLNTVQSMELLIEQQTASWLTSRGAHLLFRADTAVKTREFTAGGLRIDIKGEKSISVLPPSIHESGFVYKWLNRTEPMTIGDPEKFINGLGERLREFAVYNVVKPYWKPKQRHKLTLGLAAFLKSRDSTEERTVDIVTALCRTGGEHEGWRDDIKNTYIIEDANYHEKLKNYGTLIVDLQKLFPSRKRAESRPVAPGCPEKHDFVKYIPKTAFETPGFIVEQVNAGYVVWDKDTEKWELLPHYHTGEFVKEKAKKKGKKAQGDEEIEVEIVYTPLHTLSLESGQLVLADEPEPCESLSALNAEIEQKAIAWLFVGEEEQMVFKVQLRVAVASWFLYVFNDPKIQERIAGLVSDVGVSGGGKKRFLTIIKMIAYRPFYTLNTGKIPSIFRLLEPWVTPTLLVDEADQKETGSEAEWIQFVNSRYDGTPIPRYNATNQKMEIFRSFGLTALALRRMPRDEGTTSRMVKINATISPVELPEIAGIDIYNEFRTIRNKLLWLRLKHYGSLRFVGSSGLGVDQSWRGKETLTLYRLMAQIDPAVDKDITEISKVLTAREVENLSSTIDGLIINEIYAFIADEDTTYVKRGTGIYFIQEREDKEGVNYTLPLVLSNISKAVGAYAIEVDRSLKQFKIDTYQRFRISTGAKGAGKIWRSILKFSHLKDTDRIFQRYIPDYNHILTKISEVKETENIDRFETEIKKDPENTMIKSVDPLAVPPVPSVTEILREGYFEFGLDSEKRREYYSNNLNKGEVPPATRSGVTDGTDVTAEPKPPENIVEKVMNLAHEILTKATGQNIEQTAGGLLMRISEDLKDENITIYTIKDACELGKKKGILRERNGRWSAVT